MAPIFQELINKWVSVNRSHYTSGDKSPLPHEAIKNISNRGKSHVQKIRLLEEECTAVTSASSAMTPGSNSASFVSTDNPRLNEVHTRSLDQGRPSQGYAYHEGQLSRTIQSSLNQISPPPEKLDNHNESDKIKSKRTTITRRKSKSTRGLRRTHSQSDLLLSKFDESEKKSSKTSQPKQRQHDNFNGPPYDPTYANAPSVKNKDRYLNTATFSQQWQQSQQNLHHTHTPLKQKRKKKPQNAKNSPSHLNPHQQPNHVADAEEEIMAVFHQNTTPQAHPYHNVQPRTEIHRNPQGLPSANDHRIAVDPQEPCQSCAEMEKKLMMMQSDIQYLRSLTLNDENICFSCRNYPDTDQLSCTSLISNPYHRQAHLSHHQHHSSHHHNLQSTHTSSSFATAHKKKTHSHLYQGSANSTVKTLSTAAMSQSSFLHCDSSFCGDDKIKESGSLMEASQRLVDVTLRHQQQIEQMTKERARWQNDLHLKLTKFALLCKELNEESAKRKQEYIAAQEELEEIKEQHSAVTMEVEILRAKVALHEKEADENNEIRESLVSRDNDVLDKADSAIQKRDSMISELSGKLEVAMDTLELERYQQRQRRQIIFPVSRQYQMQAQDVSHEKSRESETLLVKNLNDQLHQAKDAAKLAEESLKEANRMALMREEELQKRCEKLTQELNIAKSGLEFGESLPNE